MTAGVDVAGRAVLVAGAGVSGLAAAEALAGAGARVTVSDDDPSKLAALAPGVGRCASDEIPDGTDLVVTSPGRRPDHALVAAAATRCRP
ncbi:NAD(P)-dependent oxidoreductase [Pseudonocardia sp. KRD291]|uniref:NAD(P)-dependent oxidoreductase n=1 Tax=Pseudonocardia sp. KRD291 TaxID=2792007 RepID=UPI001C49E1C0|nr:NAD(P)-dependent oxidoreductase [Pseudonocardia sp. KRD291]MBW0106289.1 FAD-binding protein [Pseudonocardia sp. KRD291]